MQVQSGSRVPLIFKALLPLIFALVPWLGLQYEKNQGNRALEVAMRPAPIPELSVGQALAPQIPSIKAASPPARFFTLPWFVMAKVVPLVVRESKLHLPYPLPWLGKLMLEGG
ncbi:hypothetical protein [Deinococcus misasensis]|uniref:hypothetical protein n=1 Tax=Deinococcus misasensis TaxID=392413 RepID=UPI000550FA90|nr:hypothetical protein [Deinococcus misasensis]